MSDNGRWQSRHDRARDEGRQAGAAGGDWRDNRYTPGTREYYEFEDGRAEKDTRGTDDGSR